VGWREHGWRGRASWRTRDRRWFRLRGKRKRSKKKKEEKRPNESELGEVGKKVTRLCAYFCSLPSPPPRFSYEKARSSLSLSLGLKSALVTQQKEEGGEKPKTSREATISLGVWLPSSRHPFDPSPLFPPPTQFFSD